MTAHHTSVAEMQRTAKPQDPLTIIIKIMSAGRAASPLILTIPYEVGTGIISILRMGKLRQREARKIAKVARWQSQDGACVV